MKTKKVSIYGSYIGSLLSKVNLTKQKKTATDLLVTALSDEKKGYFNFKAGRKLVQSLRLLFRDNGV